MRTTPTGVPVESIPGTTRGERSLMAVHEQIVTVKVRYDDGECKKAKIEGCCGTKCNNVTPSTPAEHIKSNFSCCFSGRTKQVEVLQAQPVTDVLTADSFET